MDEGTGGTWGEPRETIPLDIGATYGGSGPTSSNLDPLCGAGQCVPDEVSGCDLGLGGMGGAGQMGAAGGFSYDPGDLVDQGASCQVTPNEDCVDEPCPSRVRECRAAGSGVEGEPCVASADCEAGLACVGDGASGICRPYCCRGTQSSCDESSFCVDRRLTEHPALYVPVCMPVDNCPLTDPYPCPEGQDCACQGDRGCVVVRSDGTTACTRPGPGQTGDPCTGSEGVECAHGFVCSPSAGCMKLCVLSAAESGCPEGGTCQSPAEFPSDLGVCVGASSGSAATK